MEKCYCDQIRDCREEIKKLKDILENYDDACLSPSSLVQQTKKAIFKSCRKTYVQTGKPLSMGEIKRAIDHCPWGMGASNT